MDRSRRNCFERHVINFVFPPHVSNALFETLRRKKNEWNYPIVSTEAVNNKGIDELLKKINEHRKFITENHLLEKHRKEQIKSELKKIMELKLKELIEKNLNDANLDQMAERVYSGKEDPYSTAESILQDIKVLKKQN